MIPQVAGPTPITTCPHCSILVNGSCMLCADGDSHPSCIDCVNGRHKPPWHRSSLTLAITTAVVVSVISGLLVARINRKIR